MDLRDVFDQEARENEIFQCDVIINKGVSSSDALQFDDKRSERFAELIQIALDAYIPSEYVWNKGRPELNSSSTSAETYDRVSVAMDVAEATEDIWTLLSALVRIMASLKAEKNSDGPNHPPFIKAMSNIREFLKGSLVTLVLIDANVAIAEFADDLPHWALTCGDLDKRFAIRGDHFCLIPSSYVKDASTIRSVMANLSAIPTGLYLPVKAKYVLENKLNVTNSMLKKIFQAPSSRDYYQDLRLVGRGSLELPIVIPEGVKLPRAGILFHYLESMDPVRINKLRKKASGIFSFSPPFPESSGDGFVVQEVPPARAYSVLISRLHHIKLENSRPRTTLPYTHGRWRMPVEWLPYHRPAAGLQGEELKELADRKALIDNAILLGGILCYLAELAVVDGICIDELSDRDLMSTQSLLDESCLQWPLRGDILPEAVDQSSVEAFLQSRVATSDNSGAEGGRIPTKCIPRSSERVNERLGGGSDFMNSIIKAVQGTSRFDGIDIARDDVEQDDYSYDDEDWEEGEEDSDMKELMTLTSQALRAMVKSAATTESVQGEVSETLVQEARDADAALFSGSFDPVEIEHHLASSRKEVYEGGLVRGPTHSLDAMTGSKARKQNDR